MAMATATTPASSFNPTLKRSYADAQQLSKHAPVHLWSRDLSFLTSKFKAHKLHHSRSTVVLDRIRRNNSVSCTANVLGGGLATTTATTKEQVNVGVSGRDYPVFIGSGILDDTQFYNRHIKGKQVLIVTNTKVSPLYVDRVVAAILKIGNVKVQAIGLPDGEKHKNKENVFKVIDKAADAGMDNTATFVGLGGGVVNDLCAFSAAVYKGGVNYIQIPTTLIAQADVSVADETGIYHLLDKQSICSYYEPECVIVDTDVLKTLPGKELISGIAEIIKFALVRDGAYLQWLKDNMNKLLERDPDVITHAIKKSCEIKSEILSIDKKEGGFKHILSLGRPFANGILKSMEQGEWLHGEALAVGMVMMLDLSHRLGWIDDSVLIDATVAMERAHLPTAPPAYITKDTLKRNMAIPTDHNLKLALLKGPAGSSIFTDNYDPKILDSMLTFFCLGDRV